MKRVRHKADRLMTTQCAAASLAAPSHRQLLLFPADSLCSGEETGTTGRGRRFRPRVQRAHGRPCGGLRIFRPCRRALSFKHWSVVLQRRSQIPQFHALLKPTEGMAPALDLCTILRSGAVLCMERAAVADC